jgi:hypothetical protein
MPELDQFSDAVDTGHSMDVFRVRDRLIADYRDFPGSFVDKNIREHVRERMARGTSGRIPGCRLTRTLPLAGQSLSWVASQERCK